MRKLIISLLLGLLSIKGISQKANSKLLDSLLHAHPNYFEKVLSQQSTFPVQIIYTQIDRDHLNKPKFTHHLYQVNDNDYFYPASTIKMPLAFLALEKLNELKVPKLNRATAMITDSAYSNQDRVYNAPMSEDGVPSIEHYIKQIFLVSDNDAANRLYEFLGQEYIHQKLAKKGYPKSIIRHRLSVTRTLDENAVTNPIFFVDSLGKILYKQPIQHSRVKFPNLSILKGNGYYQGAQLIEKPFDFGTKNRVPLKDLHQMLMSIIFPIQFTKQQQFHISSTDRQFLLKTIGLYTNESAYPNFSNLPKTYVKFLLHGGGISDPLPHVRIFNKVGDAYGFLIDVAYIIDYEKKVEFFLSAVISCNSDQIYNDDAYDYDSVGFPFMMHLGKMIYDFESKRKKKYLPKFESSLIY